VTVGAFGAGPPSRSNPDKDGTGLVPPGSVLIGRRSERTLAAPIQLPVPREGLRHRLTLVPLRQLPGPLDSVRDASVELFETLLTRTEPAWLLRSRPASRSPVLPSLGVVIALERFAGLLA
jgi:hypothetical protein